MMNWINSAGSSHIKPAQRQKSIIVVASVSCIYGMGNPTDYESGIIRIHKRTGYFRRAFLHSLVNSLYNRTTIEFSRGTFRVKEILLISTCLMLTLVTVSLSSVMR